MATVTHESPAVETLSAWVAAYRWAAVQPEEVEEYRPSAGFDFCPSDEDIAEAAGYELGLEGGPAPDAADLTIPTRQYKMAFLGWVAGRCQRARDRELARLEAIDRGEDAFTTPDYEGPDETTGYAAGYTS